MSRSWGAQLLLAPGDKDPLPSGPTARLGDRGPADFNVRLMKNYSQPMPIFDRSKHAHVIQNQFCHLCKVTVGQEADHL
ncbi:probable palmitoyltransferase ZDHHC11B isoform X13 [Macaca fascicularis]|uniref:probable palmitoyltransferase ZDHHC11B isoform X13 n=1 Tax=Macaca fascicularis TaxID=9541 RepID=UPI003D157611